VSQAGFDTFEELVVQALTDPGAEAELRRRYEQPAAIFVVDFSEMVLRSDTHGIIYALGLARAAEAALAPAVYAAGGRVIKRVADTVFAIFDGPAAALQAALDAQRALGAFNASRHGHLCQGERNEPIRGSIGLGYGPTLVIPGEDIYGAEVNRAFVLGEDVGHGGEVLASMAFVAALGAPPAGVGTHAAPAARVDEARFPFVVIADYRD